MSGSKPAGAEGQHQRDYWVIEYNDRVVALIVADDERHAEQQAMAWARGRERQGVSRRDVSVRLQSPPPLPSRLPGLSRPRMGGFATPANTGQSLLLVGLLAVLAWLWRDLI